MARKYYSRLASVVGVAALMMPALGVAHASPTLHGARSVAGATKAPSPLVDKGGRILVHSNTYAIWWGPTANFPSDERTGIESELSGFNGSGYLAIANQYDRGSTASTSFNGSFVDVSAPPKSSPNTASLGAEVAKVLGSTPLDPNGLYLIYTSNDGAKNYCAYHDQTVVNGVSIQVGYLPNTSGVTGCDAGNLFNSPITEGTRSVADSTAHEFMEAITDAKPGTAWVDKNGWEIGDKCETATEALVPLTGSSWQLQPEWSNSANGCAFSG
jgi:hypothetical protein